VTRAGKFAGHAAIARLTFAGSSDLKGLEVTEDDVAQLTATWTAKWGGDPIGCEGLLETLRE
jgi:hypothetical protein